MPRPQADLHRRTVTLETARRSIDLPVDAAGHVRRAARPGAIEVRAEGDSAGRFLGHAAVFGERAWIGSQRWGFWEVIERGAFAKTIREKRSENADITFNRDHDNRLLLARTSNGTLRLSEEDAGLAVDADMGDYSYARDIQVALERRDLTGMSFAFDMVTYEWSIAEDGNDLLTHREAELYDVAVVGMPAYPQTDAGLRMDLLAVARASGFDAIDLGRLSERLADPDPDLVATLRTLARSDTPPPAEATETHAPDESTRDDSPPAETTGTSITHLALRHLAVAHQFKEN